MDEDGDGEPGSKPETTVGSDVDGAGDATATFALLGGPDDGPTLDLDHERFAYAGKFVVSGTGKAVARVPGPRDEDGHGEVLAAAAFDRDRTDRSVVRIRYVTVRRDRRGGGLGAGLLAALAERVLECSRTGDARTGDARTEDASTFEGVREVRIGVNNPFAYEAAYKAGFGYTGERTGLAEIVCARPGDRSAETYRRGLAAFAAREDLDGSARAFVDERLDAEPPATVAPLPGRPSSRCRSDG